jgi:hypothetical protein
MVSPNEPERNQSSNKRLEDEDGTVVGEETIHNNSPVSRPNPGQLYVDTDRLEAIRSIQSPSRTREEAFRLDDDLAVLQIERQVSASQDTKTSLSRGKTIHRSRSRKTEPVDDFELATNPTHEKVSIYRPPKDPNTNIGRIFKKVHNSIFLVRYFIYIIPVVLIILIPLLVGVFLFKHVSVGGVELVWFCIWLEIVWLSLWAGRVS